MKRLKLLFTLKSHSLIDSGEGDENMMTTREYLPGTAIIGAFAAQYIRQRNLPRVSAHQDINFKTFFLGHGLQFQNANIIFTSDPPKRSIPAPLALFRSKNGEYNLLNNRLLVDDEAAEETQLGGWLGLAGDLFYSAAVEKQIHFHHQQDSDRFAGRSTAGTIFNYETLTPDQTFLGEIRGSTEKLSLFKEQFKGIEELPIGRSKMTEYGQVKFKFLSEKPEDLEPFTESIHNGKLCITFASPAILYNKYGFPGLDSATLVGALAQQLEISPDNMEIDKAFSTAEIIENYVGIWNLRKYTDLAIGAGSTFLIRFKQTIPHVDIVQKLQNLGIGMRRHEGFGEILLNFPSLEHYRKGTTEDSKIPPKPPNYIPAEVEKLIINTFIGQIEEEVRLEALNHSKCFSLKTLAVLGRLEKLLNGVADACSFHKRVKESLSGKKAHQTLKQCRCHETDSCNLWDFIQDPPSFAKALQNNVALNCLADDRLYTSLNLEEIIKKANKNDNFCHIFWLTFIRELRKQTA